MIIIVSPMLLYQLNIQYFFSYLVGDSSREWTNTETAATKSEQYNFSNICGPYTTSNASPSS